MGKSFSKKVLTVMVVAWFVGIIYGIIFSVAQLIISPDTATVDSLLTYIGLPMGSGLVSYFIKSATENKEKIKQEYIPDYDNSVLSKNNEEVIELDENGNIPTTGTIRDIEKEKK